MSRVLIPKPDVLPVYPVDPVFPLSVEQYHEMIRIGVLTEDDPVEFLEGVLVFRMPKNPPHETCVGKIQDELPRHLPRKVHLRLQAPITLVDGEPEPDAAIVRGSRADFADHHPGPADVLLVIEVADTTLTKDRTTKLRSYARAGIAHYWIIDLAARKVEGYSRPIKGPAEPSYGEKREHDARDSIALPLDGAAVSLTIADILP